MARITIPEPELEVDFKFGLLKTKVRHTFQICFIPDYLCWVLLSAIRLREMAAIVDKVIDGTITYPLCEKDNHYG